MGRRNWQRATSALLAAAIGILSGCGGGGSKSNTPPPPVPFILNVNSSTTPSSPVGLPIEINGNGFQSAPGKVVFTQGSVTATVVPTASAWSDTGTVAVVPAGDGTTNFTVPGTVNVTVVTTGGTSNAVTVNLIQTLTFNVNNVTWTTTTALPLTAFPIGASGLRAAAVPVSATNAYVVITGGFNGTGNTTTVLSNTLAPNGAVGASWTAIATNPLPSPRAHHGMVEADAGNSLVPTGSSFLYVIGGQQNSTDTPGGTNTVFMAKVDLTTGSVGAWTQLTSNLPQALIGPGAALFNGNIYVVGGLMTNGMPSTAVYSAPVNSDGTLGAWATSPNPYPTAVSFATAFGFGGKLYVIDGDPNASANPNSQGTLGIANVNFASASRGAVGAWTSTAPTIKSRLKHITWAAFGQVIAAEGVYEGSPGSSELERTLINSDSTLASWNGITSAAQQINANVYNAGAIVSPLQSAAATPRFLLIGGQSFVTSGTGALSSKVYVNNAP